MSITPPNLSLFNSPQESAIRAGVLLAAVHPEPLDLQRLVYLDYLLVHSADAHGPPSIHPAIPMRSGEVFVRRQLVEAGVLLLCSKSLAERRAAGSNGIVYLGSEHLGAFLEAFESPYVASLRRVAHWVAETFGTVEFTRLQRTLQQVADAWTFEFDILEDRDD